jgi:hypothetical protein
MKKLLLIPLVATLFSCKSTQTSILSTPMYAPQAEINPIRADVEVDMKKKLSGSSQGTFFLGMQVSGDKKFSEGMEFSGGRRSKWARQINNLKAAAAYKAVTEANVDIIVHPNYVLDIHNYFFFSTAKIKVFGYAANFKKFYQEPYKSDTTHHAIFPSDLGKQPSTIISNINKSVNNVFGN